jgi:heat-inducible transcriptional repressor
LGYRHYVESIIEPAALPIHLRQRVDRWLGEAESDIEVWTRRCAAALSQLTANLAIVTQPRSSCSPRLKRLQLVFLQESIALLVIVLGEARLLKRLLPLDDSVNQERLDRASQHLNDTLAGLNRQQIESRLLELDSLEQRVRLDSLDMMQEAEQSELPEHHLEGLGRVLNQPEFAAGEQARHLVKAVEDRVLLERVVDAARESGPKVFIGSENREESLRGFGVIVCRYGRPDGVGGAICVVGPTRMGYATAIAGTRHLADMMGQMVQTLEASEAA